MSYALQRRLIETAYKVGMPPGSKIQWGNSPFQAPAGGYTRITILGGTTGRLIGIGRDSGYRYVGVIDVSIFVPRDQGESGLYAVADQVHDALAYQSLSEGGTRILTESAPLVVLGPAGDWHQGSVSIDFTRDSYVLVPVWDFSTDFSPDFAIA